VPGVAVRVKKIEWRVMLNIQKNRFLILGSGIIYFFLLFFIINSGIAGAAHNNYKFLYITGGIDIADPSIGESFKTEISPNIGMGYSFNNRNTFSIGYSEHDFDSTFSDSAAAAGPLQSITDINSLIPVNIFYDSTSESYKDKEIYLEYKYYFQGRQNLFSLKNSGYDNFKNAYPYIGMALGKAQVDYLISYNMNSNQPLLSQKIEESVVTYHAIIGSDLNLGRNWLLTFQGEYVFGDESYSYSSGDINVDPNKITSLTDAQRQAVSVNRSTFLNKNTEPELEISEARFSLKLAYIF
jgi:hypothetical protein